MFLGEMLCLFTFNIINWRTRNMGSHPLTQGNQNFNPFILMPAAMFDLVSTQYATSLIIRFLYRLMLGLINVFCFNSQLNLFQVGTSIMYIGLTLTYASSFQMFRGSIIIFVALLSVIFLEKQIIKREYVGIGKSD